jgi:hypothetical protein
MKSTGAFISLLLLWAMCAPAGAGPTWPGADNLWNPVLVGGSPYVDAQADSGADATVCVTSSRTRSP